ncbi:MAG: methyltransferase domain-containing protein [Planctomycetota bacterium]
MSSTIRDNEEVDAGKSVESKEAVNTDQFVKERYSAASQAQEQALCCPVVYDTQYLKVIPEEIIDRDYGCGDPSPYVREGDTVVDLGSGGGKLCFIISQLVGESGKVIGVDFNPDMLELARSHQQTVADRIGYDNIQFRSGRIQDLAIDLEQLAQELSDCKTESAGDALAVMELPEKIRNERPMIDDASVDCVVSNCVLNLVRDQDREQLFREIFRVLKPGGRAAISDIVSDEDVPERMKAVGTLWSGCLSGAWREDRFVSEFEKIGFGAVAIDKRQEEPWQTVEGIEFRSVTIVATKPLGTECKETNKALIYRGPFKKVHDDEGHLFIRGQRTAVCDRMFNQLTGAEYNDAFFEVLPVTEIPVESAAEFDCSRHSIRDPRETKGQQYNLTIVSDGDCCGTDDSGCC